ncbi:hypothetical protein [Streptomyces sp. CCM_MD2014]|uniref:hypothetical protein n=1 Tax=Streptomyces sp. CCM_MD2014 TaxID=1561022 RepID=UPI00052A4EDD|nr:hypothetical protein [Streptomyces sp. CCM_MD2014]AIV35546.1 hypothetical protein NI25_20240 [Streptomyces sp. CCM_MD2014]
MTDLALAAVLVFMAVLLGAASLAIVLLYRGWKTNRALITDLKAQVAAQQIAALTGGVSARAPGDEEPAAEPVRRRRHLTLYLGGGVAVVYTTCRDSIRNFIRTRPAITAATVATVASVSTAAALVLAPGGSADSDGPAPSTATTDQPEAGALLQPDPVMSTGDTDPDDPGNEEELWVGAPNLTLVESTRGDAEDEKTPEPAASTTAAEAEPDEEQPRGGAPSASPPGTQPGPESSQPPRDPKPTTLPPTPESPEAPTDQDDDSGLCVDLPPLVDLCLLTGS